MFYDACFQWPQDTFKAENMVQLGMLSILPYFAELVLEHGPVRAITSILHQVRVASRITAMACGHLHDTSMYRPTLYGPQNMDDISQPGYAFIHTYPPHLSAAVCRLPCLLHHPTTNLPEGLSRRHAVRRGTVHRNRTRVQHLLLLLFEA